ncbi:BREX-1 system adenine-specific DNA-methyltransferase PglX, partial [Methylomonas sp. MgM2]
ASRPPGASKNGVETEGMAANFNSLLSEVADARQGLATTDNNRFLRMWYEIGIDRISFGMQNSNEALQSSKKWFPYNKGGAFRKWYGNQDFVVNWENDGREIKDNILRKYTYLKTPEFVAKNPGFYFRSSISWSRITSSVNSFRYYPHGFIFDQAGHSIFTEQDSVKRCLMGYLNNKFSTFILNTVNPTMNLEVGYLNDVPYPNKFNDFDLKVVDILIERAKKDWNTYETSWDFTENPLICQNRDTLYLSFENWQLHNNDAIVEMQQLEEENNRIFIESYDLQDELTPEVPLDQITLTINPKYRYGGNLSNQELYQRFQADTFVELISYAIGCMMGRYSLDEPGLIYAHAGNVDFDPSRYPSFAADEDGILPLTDQEWFKDDATNRFREFLVAVWGEDTLQQNLEFVAESLTLSSFKPKKGETSLDTVRRYLSSQFYKDHLQTYKKRPIYWLFSSGKQKAFECLVYLHRYNDSTLARMRTEYVTPLLGKYSAYADQLNQQLQDASSSEAARIKKDIQALEKKQTELRQFDDKLKHYADMRIKLDLDDGVKVNYGKFGDLLAEVKAVTGGTGD